MEELAATKVETKEDSSKEDIKKDEDKTNKKLESIERVESYLKEKYVIEGSVRLDKSENGDLKLVDVKRSSSLVEFSFDDMGNFEVKHKNKSIITTKTSFSFLAENNFFVATKKE